MKIFPNFKYKKCYLICSIFIILTILLGLKREKLYAADDSSPSGESSSSSQTLINKLKQIETLKEKIATKVSELRTQEKGGVWGTVKSLNKEGALLSSAKGDVTITYADDTLFYQATDSGKTEISIKKINAGDSITVVGYFDTNRTNISAKYVYINPNIQRLSGIITDMDKSNYTISVKTIQGSIIVDIETYSRMYLLSKDKGITKTGFSKLKVGDEVRLIGNPNPKEDGRISARRIISFMSSSASPTPEITTGKESLATPVVKVTKE